MTARFDFPTPTIIGNLANGEIDTDSPTKKYVDILDNNLFNGNSRTTIAEVDGPMTVQIGDTPNVAVFSEQGITVQGNTVSTRFIGDGSLLTNLPTGSYSNANVAAYLPTYTGTVGTDSMSNVLIGQAAGSEPNTASAFNRVAIGFNAGSNGSQGYSIAIGSGAGAGNHGYMAIAIGQGAGTDNSRGIAIGDLAGKQNQGGGAIALGASSGQNGQGDVAVAVGYLAGGVGQGTGGVAMGWHAGETNQGAWSIAIGANAASNTQHVNSIVLNATSQHVESASANSFVVKPVATKNDAGGTLVYNSTSGEVFMGIPQLPNYASLSAAASQIAQPQPGSLIFDSANSRVAFYNGTNWANL